MERKPINLMDAYALAEEEREREEDERFEQLRKTVRKVQEDDILTCPTQKVETENDLICREQEKLFNNFRQKNGLRVMRTRKKTKINTPGQQRLPGV